MDELKNVVITEIENPFVVHSKKGKKFQMIDRRCFGISLCMSGQITYEMNGKSFVATENTVTFLPKGATYTLIGDEDGLFSVINFNCNGLICNEITVISLSNPQVLISCFETIKKQYYNKTNRLQIFSVFYNLLFEIASQKIVKHSRLLPAIKYIEQNLSCQTLTNEVVAKSLKISEVYLRKLFLTHLNTTPKQYILELRLQKAKQLLIDTEFTVTDISEKCGFSSVYHFCRIFKEKSGLTPLEYSKQYKVFEV